METKSSIKRLDPSVVSKIAAGEVVKRPANAVKEMIENSIDAKATSIQVVVKNGGMKLLQVIDNGTGISKEDLEIICERHTTSKLETLNDLLTINTYGFRGEALCSISQIAHVSMKTKTSEGRCGYAVSFVEGKMKGKPAPCAANQGTQITVENMFYNVPLRMKLLKNFNEEFKRIWNIVARYAVHNSSVSFSLKKYGQNDVNIKTTNNSSTKDVISSIFGVDVARNLVETRGSDETLLFKYKIYTTNLNYSSSQFTFLLFINHRLVKAEGLQKDISELYNVYLPRKSYPFVYISLEMAPQNVDVNVHPTKETVFYLYEEPINKKVISVIQKLITGKDAYETYKEKALTLSQEIALEENLNPNKKGLGSADVLVEGLTVEGSLDTRESCSDVTTDSTAEKHDNQPTYAANNNEFDVLLDEYDQQKSINYLLPELGSLKASIIEAYNRDLKELLEKASFLTCLDHKHILIRKGNFMFICQLEYFCQEYFYQMMINQIGRINKLVLSEPVPLMLLLQYANSEFESSKEKLDAFHHRLMENRSNLNEIYSIEIDGEGNLLGIPSLLNNYYPTKEFLPEFILNLAQNVPWGNKQPCIHAICMEVSYYYSRGLITENCRSEDWNNYIKSTLFPELQKHLLPSNTLYTEHITEMINFLDDDWSQQN